MTTPPSADMETLSPKRESRPKRGYRINLDRTHLTALRLPRFIHGSFVCQPFYPIQDHPGLVRFAKQIISVPMVFVTFKPLHSRGRGLSATPGVTRAGC